VWATHSGEGDKQREMSVLLRRGLNFGVGLEVRGRWAKVRNGELGTIDMLKIVIFAAGT
jgi:hypothetical protein